MKKLVATVLVLAAAAFAQEPAQPQTAPPAGAQAQAQPGAPAQQQKQIKDPAEYNAYMSAVNQTDPAAKAAALESFLQQYPNSVMKGDAMELLMTAYTQANNASKAEEAANRVLAANPNNIRALALLTYTSRAAAERGGPDAQAALQRAVDYAQRGLQAEQTATKPQEFSEPDWEKLKAQTATIFNGAAGFGAIQRKDYKQAQKYLQAAVDANPNNLSDVYPLALSYLEDTPMNPTGLWYVARAVNLSQSNPAVARYGRSKYIKYHGGEDGWTELVAAAATSPAPPPGFSIKPAPTPAEQAATMVQNTPVNKMSFGDFVLVFTSGNQQAADTVWNEIKDKPLAIEGSVISATPTKLMIAATVDDIQAKKADIELTMAAPLTRLQVPKEGATIQFEGTPVTYTAQPSFIMQMSKGALLTKAAPKAAPATRKRTSTTRRPPPK